ncbi:CaiB/BaiF CoA-transferase family protein [Desulfurella sp.]|uniref:CaiB/BaiF CoA transferase family protein n=1 Tax=Desulfurella sp. TaxID=1962857 RepID=UPI0025B8CE26|nr:CaiB/BaiF CoA-transferase family protein [Desulfurella sp.]
MYQILNDLTVLDLTNVLAGPFCTYHLAMMGANVIKIERPKDGDLARKLGASKKLNKKLLGSSFLAQNAGKKSVILDLKNKNDLEKFYKLAKKADIVVENFKPGTIKKLKIDYDILSNLNTQIIYCSISGFGQYGQLSNKVAYDQIIQGLSGVMSLNGTKEINPLRCGFPICDTVGGLTATMAILAALYFRIKKHKGTYIDISMFDSMLPMLGWAASNFLIANKKPELLGNDNFTAAPSGTFITKNGLINIAANEDKQWINLCKAIKRNDLILDVRFADREKRKENRVSLNKILNEILKKRTTDFWVDLFEKYDIPSGEILDLSKVLKLSHTKERNMLIPMRLDYLNRTINIINIAPKFSNIKEESVSPPPTLGEHSEAILNSL